MKLEAFTLSELLVSLAVLGIIAAISIPKIYNALEEKRKYTVIKETIATIEAVSYKAFMEAAPGTRRVNWFKKHMAYAKYCEHGINDGCVVSGMIGQTGEDAFVLHNGAVIYSISYNPTWGNFNVRDDWNIDWNGAAGPNQQGVDMIRMEAPRFNESGPTHTYNGSKTFTKPIGGTGLYNRAFGLS